VSGTRSSHGQCFGVVLSHVFCGVKSQSPNWTYGALGNAAPVDRAQSGGNWKSPAMVLKYVWRTGIANEGVIITE
jgi:hypothetical protein